MGNVGARFFFVCVCVHSYYLLSLQFDGVFVVSGSLDTSIRVWDAETGRDADYV